MSRLLPWIIFLLALIPGLAMTFVVNLSAERRQQAEFERAAELAIDRVVSRLDRHVVVLRAARGLLSASRGGISRDEFVRFLDSFDIAGDLSGLQGVGFARMLDPDNHAVAKAEIARNYDLDVQVDSTTHEPWITPIVLLEPSNDRNTAALGFDMYSESTRRSAMDHAIASGEAQMSGPVELVQEITQDKQTGFLVYLPFNAVEPAAGVLQTPVAGFIYAPFRAGDLVEAALSNGPVLAVSLRLLDTGAPSMALYDGLQPERDTLRSLTRTVTILGRQWQFELTALESGTEGTRYLESLLLALISLLFAAAAAYAVAARQAEAIQAREVARAASREAEYRALSLQEMKHRIKNHIARIQSIARQSARGATDVKAFTTAFDARLQSMSAVQEILAGTAAAQADIRDILASELLQSRDGAQVQAMLNGPDILLDERRAQAFALMAHELVTNAMKYGGLSTNDSQLQVSWHIQTGRGSAPAMVALDWVETAPGIVPGPARPGGFGSRLIDISLKSELSGTIDREFAPGRLHIRISFPL